MPLADAEITSPAHQGTLDTMDTIDLTRAPRTWVKPRTAAPQPVRVPYRRSDDFSASQLQPLWRWNHVPVDDKWSLSERPGFLRLHALPATSFYDACDTLTQRAMGRCQRRPSCWMHRT